MISEFLRAFALIFLAEMGDKTQILAMAFATKYKIRNVILGIFLGSLLNHSLAVILGSSLSTFIPLNTLSIVAGIMFVIFALWSLKHDEEDEEIKDNKYGPTLTVAIAFFVGELGDKTQLTAIALSTDTNYPLFILIGTVTGMVLTGLLGIFVGIKLGSKIPEFYIKIGASIVFFIFGYIKLFSSLPTVYLKPIYYIPFTIMIMMTAYIILRPTLIMRKQGKSSYYKQVAERLKVYYSNIYFYLEDICLGETKCGKCDGRNCLVGFTKDLVTNAKTGNVIDLDYIEGENQKNFDLDKVLKSYELTLEVLIENWENEKYKEVHKIRKILEKFIFSLEINELTYENYLKKLKVINQEYYKEINKE